MILRLSLIDTRTGMMILVIVGVTSVTVGVCNSDRGVNTGVNVDV